MVKQHAGLGACSDAKAAGVSHLIKWHSGPCSQWEPRETPATVMVNPPWGLRLLNDAEEEDLPEGNRWFAGDILTSVCGCQMLISVSNLQLFS